MYVVLEGKIEQQVFVFNLNQKILFMLQHRLGREKNQSSDEKVSSYRSQASHSGIFTYRNYRCNFMEQFHPSNDFNVNMLFATHIYK